MFNLSGSFDGTESSKIEVSPDFLKIFEYIVDCRLGLPSGILKRFALNSVSNQFSSGEGSSGKNFEAILKQTEIPQSSDHTRWKWADVKDIIIESLHIEEKLKEAQNFKFIKRLLKFYKLNNGDFVKRPWNRESLQYARVGYHLMS